MRNEEKIGLFADSMLKDFFEKIQRQVMLIFPQDDQQVQEIKDVLDVWRYLDERFIFDLSPLREVCNEHKIYMDKTYDFSSAPKYFFYTMTPHCEVRYYPDTTLVTIKNGSITRKFGLKNNYQADLVGICKEGLSFSALEQMAQSFRPFIEECITTIDKM